MKSNQYLLMSCLIFNFSSAQAWDYVDDGQGYVYGDGYDSESPAYGYGDDYGYDRSADVSGNYYVQAPARNTTPAVTPEMVYRLLLQRKLQNMQSEMAEQRLDNLRHQQNL